MKCLLSLALLVLGVGLVRGEEPARLVEVRKIWDQGPHNAFTDLVRFKNRWFCVFREGANTSLPMARCGSSLRSTARRGSPRR